MTIIQRTVIYFFEPEEHKKALRFEKSNPDWQKNVTSTCISFSKTENVSAKWGLIDDT